MSKAKFCYCVVASALLFVGIFAFGTYFWGKRAVNYWVHEFLSDKKGSLLSTGLVNSFDYGKVVIKGDFSSLGIRGIGNDEKKSLFPSLNVSVQGFAATFDEKVKLEVESVLLSYDLIGGKEMKISIPSGNVQMVVRRENGVNDALECGVGAELVLGFRENVFVNALKRRWFSSTAGNQIIYAHYRDGVGVSCKSLGKSASVYDNADFELRALGEKGIKVIADITTKKEGGSGFLSLGIKDMEIFFISGDSKGFDVNIPKFRFWSDNFSSSISGVAFVAGSDIFGLLDNCKLDLLIETRGYENFFEFVENTWSVVAGQNNDDNFLRGMGALKSAVRNVSSFEEELDNVVLEIKSDAGEHVKIGSKPLGEFMDMLRELYEKKGDGDTLNSSTALLTQEKKLEEA